MITGTSPTGNFTLPVRSVLDLRYETVVRQRYDFSCGSAALATLLRYHYGRRVREDDAFRGMWAEGDKPQIRKLGFSLLDMRRYLASVGFQSDGYRVTLDQIATTGIPGIALITIKGYKHFVVVKGVSPREVLLGDPSTGLQVMPRERFTSAWNGVYFVLNSDQAFGKSAFNRRSQWNAYARAPVGGRYLEPPGLQALALTAPFYRDF
jgi:predicted double-glycine peptidase